jgi:hypothetical protein
MHRDRTNHERADAARGAPRRRGWRAGVLAGAAAVAVALALPAGALAQASFSGPEFFHAGGDNPRSFAVGDLNNDSNPDLAVANASSDDVTVLLGGGSGHFAATGDSFSVGDNPRSVAVGDFNGDSEPDLAVANQGSLMVTAGDVSVLLGRGDGSFDGPSTLTAGANPSSVAVGDFNGDAEPDLAVTNWGSSDVSVLIGEEEAEEEDVRFAAAANFDTGSVPSAAAVGHFNGDSEPDLAVANAGSDNISVLPGKVEECPVDRPACVEFESADDFDTGNGPTSVAVGNFNGDSELDLAVANFAGDSASVLLGRTEACPPGRPACVQFGSASNLPVGSFPSAVAVSDFDGDSEPDLAVANQGGDSVSVLLGQAEGEGEDVSFDAQPDIPAGFDPSSLAVGDFTRDSDPDLAVTIGFSDEVGVLFNNHINDSPVANDDTGDAFTTDEDMPLRLEASDVLGNDDDHNGDALIVTQVSDPVNGSVTLNEDGSVTYRPDLDFNGSGSFTYRASDGSADSGPATVTIQVRPVNDAPDAAPDEFVTDEDTPLTVSREALLANDSDADGDGLNLFSLSRLDDPDSGSLDLNGDGTYTYTPAPNFNGSATFRYVVMDSSREGDSATVTINVIAVNDAPVAAGDAYATEEDTPLSVDVQDVLENDTDLDGDSLTVTDVSDPVNGSVTLNGDGTLTYTPKDNFHGSGSFSYRASDRSADSPPATVTVDVGPVDDTPGAADDAYATDEDTPLTVATPGVLANDADPDGDGLTVTRLSDPDHGSVTLNGDGSLTYTPAPDYNGSDSFRYRVSDDGQDSDPATVRIDVRPVDEIPPAGPAPTSPGGAATTPNTDAAPPAPTGAPPLGPAAPAESAIARLRLRPSCVRRSRSGRVRIRISLRMPRPRPLQFRIDRAVGARVRRSCPKPNPERRFTGLFREIATLRQLPQESDAAAASVTRRITLKPRLTPGLYRIVVRAELDGDRLSSPLRRYLRVLG